MNKLEKMRRLIQATKKHSILYQLQNKETSKTASLQKKNHSIQKQKEIDFSLISVLNLEPNLENSISHRINQEKNTVETNLSENGLTLKLKKVQNYANSLTLRQQRSVYYDTVKNVSSLIAKPVGAGVRINKSQFSRKTMKSLRTKGSQEEENESVENKKINFDVFVLQRPRRLRRSPKKLACRSISKVKRTLSPKRQISPLKGMKISGWQVNQQPQFEWQ